MKCLYFSKISARLNFQCVYSAIFKKMFNKFLTLNKQFIVNYYIHVNVFRNETYCFIREKTKKI